MAELLRIAIDGPSGSGKSTAAKKLASAFSIDYIDTGAMYRAFALKAIRNNIDGSDLCGVLMLLDSTDIDYSAGRVYLDGEDVSDLIRTPEVAAAASRFSAIPAVRDKLGEFQIKMAKTRSLIMDGRDIGTIIIPDAEFKFYITASARVRAMRRCLELKEKGIDACIEKIEEDIVERDRRDICRDYHPLKKAADAIELDTSSLTIEQTVEKMTEYINAQFN